MDFLYDVKTSFVREMKPLISGWVWLAFGLVQPLLYIGLFVPLLGDVGGAGVSPLQWFIPGMMVMLTLFGTAMVGWSLTEELLSGVLERFLATPMSRPALLMGRALKEMFPLFFQAVVMIVIAIPFGLRIYAVEMLYGLVLLGLFGVGVAALSYALAIAAKNNTSLFYMVSQSVALPLMLLGGVLLPLESGPAWLYVASRFNPLTYLIEAERALFMGELFSTTVLYGTLVVAATLVIGLAIGGSAIRKASI
ncbi:ABC transporter permease [Devosia sediminis]|uniref:Transport permease protein n=1 Tax=Devosia sediminis TaxID=2798801 RepID=A0A934MLC3_9HYPH|nr:ABC transporter permease [Devosia sediminis]MBJ3786078.1 ABC transporter permease [Devosia sediminis]